jgi:hypothetical protein
VVLLGLTALTNGIGSLLVHVAADTMAMGLAAQPGHTDHPPGHHPTGPQHQSPGFRRYPARPRPSPLFSFVHVVYLPGRRGLDISAQSYKGGDLTGLPTIRQPPRRWPVASLARGARNIMRKMIKILIAAVIIVAVPVVGLSAGSTAYAGTGTPCYGNGISALGVAQCNGLDPTQSYNFSTGGQCSSGSSTVLSENILSGSLELRWGPNCATNWARFTPGNNDKYAIWVTNTDTGVWAGTGLYNTYTWSGQAGIVHYSDQVFAPDPQPASACVQDITKGAIGGCISQ